MKNNCKYICIGILAMIACKGCNEWQNLQSNNSFQEACINSGGEHADNKCKCRDENNFCDDGVVCVNRIENNEEKHVCAGRTGEAFKKLCESSGGEYQKDNNNEDRCKCPNEEKLCDHGVVCDLNQKICAGSTGTSYEKLCISSGGKYKPDTNQCYCGNNEKPCDEGIVCGKNTETDQIICLSSAAIASCSAGESKCIKDTIYICKEIDADTGTSWVKDRTCPTKCNDNYICEDECNVVGKVQCGTEISNQNNRYECVERNVKIGKDEQYTVKELRLIEACDYGCLEDNNNNGTTCKTDYIEERTNKLISFLKTIADIDHNYCSEAKCNTDYYEDIKERYNQCDYEVYEQCLEENKCIEKHADVISGCSDAFDLLKDLTGCGVNCITTFSSDDCCNKDSVQKIINDVYIGCTDCIKICETERTKCKFLVDKGATELKNTQNSCKSSCPSLNNNVIKNIYETIGSLYSSDSEQQDVTPEKIKTCEDDLNLCLTRLDSIEGKESIVKSKACLDEYDTCLNSIGGKPSAMEACLEGELTCKVECQPEDHLNKCDDLCQKEQNCTEACKETPYCQLLCKQQTISCLEQYENWVVKNTIPILNRLLERNALNNYISEINKYEVVSSENLTQSTYLSKHCDSLSAEDCLNQLVIDKIEHDNPRIHRNSGMALCTVANSNEGCQCNPNDKECLANQNYCLAERAMCHRYLNDRSNAVQMHDRCTDGAYCAACQFNDSAEDNLVCMYNDLATNIGQKYQCTKDGLLDSVSSFCTFTDKYDNTFEVSCKGDTDINVNSGDICGECVNGDIKCTDVNINGDVKGQLSECINGAYRDIETCNNVSCMLRGPIYSRIDDITHFSSDDLNQLTEKIAQDRRNWTCGVCNNEDTYNVKIKNVCGDHATARKKFVAAMLTGTDVCDKNCVAKTKECMPDPCTKGIDCSEVGEDSYKKTTYDTYLEIAGCKNKPVPNITPGNVSNEYNKLISDPCFTASELHNYYDNDKNCAQACADYDDADPSDPYSICAANCSDQSDSCLAGDMQADYTWSGGCADSFRPCYECKKNAIRAQYEDYHKTFDTCRAINQTHVNCLQSGIDFECMTKSEYIEGGCINNINNFEDTDGIDRFVEKYTPTPNIFELNFPCVNGRWELDPNLTDNQFFSYLFARLSRQRDVPQHVSAGSIPRFSTIMTMTIK